MSVEWEPLRNREVHRQLSTEGPPLVSDVAVPGFHRQWSPSQGPSLGFLALQSCLLEAQLPTEKLRHL